MLNDPNVKNKYPAKSIPSQQIIKELIAQNHMPVVPKVLAKLEHTMANPNVSVDDVVKVVRKDPVVVSRIMLTANSAMYRAKQEIEELDHAVNHLGVSKVRNIVHAASLHATIKASPRIKMRAFWRNAIVAAITTKLLAELYNKKTKDRTKHIDVDAAFLGGMVRDLGAILLDHYFAEDYKRALGFTPRVLSEVVHNEIYKLGTSHGVLSGSAMAFWNFPKSIAIPVAGHHNLAKTPEIHRPLASLIYLGEEATLYLGYENGIFNAKLFKITDEAMEIMDDLGISIKDYKNLIEVAIQIAEESNMLKMFA